MGPGVGKTSLESRALSYEPLEQFRPTALQDDSALADNHGKRIGIVIVTFNAVTTLMRVLKRITPNVWRNVEQVVVLDDASSDATFELAVGIKTLVDLPKLQVLKHPRNLGYGGNQKAAYQYLLEQGFDVVVLLHGDGQYAPELLSHLYGPIVRGEADAVFGSRMMKTYGGPIKGGMPLYKYVGNRILTFLENRALGMHLTEFHSGYRAYSLQALRQIDFLRMTDEFHFDTEIIIKLHHQNFQIREVPIPTFYGDEVCYVNGLKYAKDILRAVWRYKQTTRAVKAHPEFQEYFVPCPPKRSKYSSHFYARQMVSPAREVLEVKRGESGLAERLAADGVSVTEMRLTAQGLQESERFPARRFDRILALDLLEHQFDPAGTLRLLRRLVKPDGLVILSVPNVANFTVRLMLLAGRFRYADRGILDHEHVRFFTRRTIRELVEDAGFDVMSEQATAIPLERVIALNPEGRLLRTLTRLLGLATRMAPSLLGYEVVLAARLAK